MFLTLTLAVLPVYRQNDLLVKFFGPEFVKLVALDPADTQLRKLRKERCLARGMAIALNQVRIEIGHMDIGDHHDHIKLVDAFTANAIELVEKPANRVVWFEWQIAYFRKWEERIQKSVEDGFRFPASLKIVRAARMDAELAMLTLKESLQNRK